MQGEIQPTEVRLNMGKLGKLESWKFMNFQMFAPTWGEKDHNFR